MRYEYPTATLVVIEYLRKFILYLLLLTYVFFSFYFLFYFFLSSSMTLEYTINALKYIAYQAQVALFLR